MRTADRRRVNRREFLRQGSAAAVAVLAGNRLLEAAPTGPMAAIVRDKTLKSIEGNKVDADIVQRLVDKAVMTLAGKDDVAKAWAVYVSPKDRVAVKFNGLFRNATTHPEVIRAVTNGLVKAGVDPAKIVVYDRSDKDFETARVAVNRGGTGVPAYGTGNEYGSPTKAGPVSTKLSKILTEADVLINLPVLKTHEICGVTGALKNHLGTVPNAGEFHGNGCLAVADLNTLGPIKDKTRICIADGLYGLYHGGPGFKPQYRWDYHGIIASVDPVALDATLEDILKEKRLEQGMSPRHQPTTHIARAAELGVGVADLTKINRVALEI
ncbi:MAG TPA: DUF362 domain-containing protein [Sumerlaeia bacterium]|nr:DUF362 domain-containing protein [Sumerlaeia bacterium]